MRREPRKRVSDQSPAETLDGFGAIVGRIYECALDPTGWPAALDAIRTSVGGAAAWIAIHYPDQVRSVYQIQVGTDPEWQRRLREHYVAASPFIGITHHLPSGAVISVEDAIDYDEFLTGRFYQEWSAPQGWPDFILAIMAREPDRFSWLGICLTERASMTQKRRAGLFRPHVERALRISDLLEMKSTEAADLAAAVAGLATGMVLVDAELFVRGINPAAERLMAEAGWPAATPGLLRLPASAAGRELRRAVTASAEGQLDRACTSVAFDRADGGIALMVDVLPLARALGGPRREAVAALFLTNPVAPVRAPMDMMVKRYGLTPSETRVLLAILEGKSPRAIAATQGVGMPTVRSHLHRLFDKTGTTGQTDVVRLVSSLSRPIEGGKA